MEFIDGPASLLEVQKTQRRAASIWKPCQDLGSLPPSKLARKSDRLPSLTYATLK
jgi:hypothetical protein